MKSAAAVRAHRCNRCDRYFARLEHLQRHERSHTKEKPFRCLKCTQAFTRKDLLTRHDRLVHNAQDVATPTIGTSRVLSFPKQGDKESTNFTPAFGRLIHDHIVATDHHDAATSLQQLKGSLLTPELTETPHPGPGVSVDSFGEEFEYIPSANDFDHPGVQLVDDFASFLDSISIPVNPFSPTYQPLPYFSPDERYNTSNGYIRDSATISIREPTFSTGVDSGLSRFGSRLPSIQPEELPQTSNPTPKPRSHYFSRVSVECHAKITNSLATYVNVVDSSFVLPSRHALSRFIAGYITGFHEHYPFLHIPTLSVDSISLELFLSIAALGAKYCREPEKSLELFRVAKVVALEHIRRRDASYTAVRSFTSGADWGTIVTEIAGSYTTQLVQPGSDGPGRPIQTVQALLILIALATWSERNPSAREALSIRSVLDWLIHEDGLGAENQNSDGTWRDWVRLETIKRTALIVFCFFNLHTIVFDIPPMNLSSEIVLNLPCSEREWKADSADTWIELRSSSKSEPSFQDVFQSLFNDRGTNTRNMPSFSSLGGYILIHAVIQHVWLLQQAARLPPRQASTLSLEEVTSVEKALKRWRHGWEQDRESSIDPLSPHGPLSFTSTALLRMAYIRINIDTGSIRSLSTWDADRIARSLVQSPPIQRSDKMTRAALHCAHGLSIPIKLGINFVAHTQVFFWSLQHALCSLECALLLAKWLEATTVANPEPALTHEETRLLEFVVQMIAETEYSAPPERLFENNKHLAAVVVRVWAKLFRSDSIWEMVDLIGRSLRAYADLLESENG
jgi:hypothetical protein